MAQAIVIHQPGGPGVLQPQTITVGKPGPNELRIRQTAIGVNFHDVYVRSGLYQTLPLPGIPGIEAVGIVEETGSQVTNFTVGDRIGYITRSYGVYTSERLLPADLAIRLPDSISDDLAATLLLKGLTAEMLVKQVHPVKPGERVLVHAAAGGVGRLLCQWASHLGATVIGTVGNAQKAELARQAGCAHTILYREENVVERVQDITNGKGVNVAYDSVGKDTFQGSLDSLAICGHLVNFGQSSGSVAPFEVSALFAKSNSLTRPSVFHYARERHMLDSMSNNLFNALEQGAIKAEPGMAFALADAARAHEMLESRERTGALLLKP